MFEQDMNTYWKTVVDTIQEGVVVVSPDGQIVSVNQGMEYLTGYSRPEVLGNSCLIFNCDICTKVRKEEKDYWCSLFRIKTLRMRHCKIQHKDGHFIPVVKNASVLTGQDGSMIGAVETLTDLSEVVKKEQQLEAYRKELDTAGSSYGLLGNSPAMQRIFGLIPNAAKSDAPVIVTGQSGTGKELVAQAIHASSDRKDKPLIRVNCAALPESLLESELFGHVKGSFTGAVANREGRFQAAQGGYIFLDEIGDIPPSTQVKLLRVLEERVIERVGDHRPVPVDVRVITATNKNLQELVQVGIFREDLYYRVNVIPIHLPALKDRLEDLPLLVETFFHRLQVKTGKKIQGISPEAMNILYAYPWPGNIRELKSVFEYAFVVCDQPTIQPEHLLPSVLETENQSPSPSSVQPMTRTEKRKQELIQALKRTGGNKSEAAKLLGVSRTTIWNRMRRFKIACSHTITDKDQ
ncbi:MAG: sigma 54-interacting transcriptional regulator [Desulfovermiculus sp.]|nr:sigma 54-interacting transcriptional regulator [Desulfovermiculus sp.]